MAPPSRHYQQERFRLIFENSPIAIWEEDLSALYKLKTHLTARRVKNVRTYLVNNLDLVLKIFRGIRVLDVNKAALKLYGSKSKKELISGFGKTVNPHMMDVIVSEFTALLEGKNYFEAEFRMETARGRIHDILLKVSIPDEYKHSFSRAIVTLQDISEQKKLERHLRKIAQLDSLTRLYNHSTVKQRLDAELLRSRRYGSSLSCMMIDVDHFKNINDQYGHQKGDMIIRKVAQTLRGSMRQVDIIGRYGGDEFMIILPETKALNAKIAAERLKALFNTKQFPVRKNLRVKLSLSIGICGYPSKDIREVKDFIMKADKALYAAKKQGRNRIVVL